MAFLHFIASNWWVWLILDFCCFGIFFTNLSSSLALTCALKEGVDVADDDTKSIGDAWRVGIAGTKKRQKAINEDSASVLVALAYLGTKLFTPLLIVGVGLRLFGLGG